ncbi:hypothetical protein ACFWCH_12490 [Microbacterium sp. NPDC060132]|uniref:hypothetical protein n=1 Tax=unclassified Microbacterium TaxID=2609290 RepID=UPI003661D5FA
MRPANVMLNRCQQGVAPIGQNAADVFDDIDRESASVVLDGVDIVVQLEWLR